MFVSSISNYRRSVTYMIGDLKRKLEIRIVAPTNVNLVNSGETQDGNVGNVTFSVTTAL